VRGRGIGIGVVVACALAVVAVACAPVVAPPPEAAPTRATTFPPVAAPAAFTAVAPPLGALSNGTREWYRAPAPGGRSVTLGVYRPASPSATPPLTVLVLHGNDGFRQQYEALAARLARSGLVAIVGCWFDRPEQRISDAPDATSCSGGPTFKGAQRGIPDVNALVAAADQVADVDGSRLVLLGHSYGATVALDRAAGGASEPVVSTAGLLARSPVGAASPAPGDVLPADPGVAARIDAPVLLAHGVADTITPIGQAKTLATLLAAAGNPPTTRYYAAPADHSFPFVSAPAARFVSDLMAWLATLTLPSAATASEVPGSTTSTSSTPSSTITSTTAPLG
jgi:dienelactone hydrolase